MVSSLLMTTVVIVGAVVVLSAIARAVAAIAVMSRRLLSVLRLVVIGGLWLLNSVLNMDILRMLRCLLHMMVHVNILVRVVRLLMMMMVMVVPCVRLRLGQVGLINLHLIGSLVHYDGAAANQPIVIIVSVTISFNDRVEGDRLSHDRVVSGQILQQVLLSEALRVGTRWGDEVEAASVRVLEVIILTISVSSSQWIELPSISDARAILANVSILVDTSTDIASLRGA